MDYLTWMLRYHDGLTPQPPDLPEEALRSVLWFRGQGTGDSALPAVPAGEEQAALLGAGGALAAGEHLLERLRAGETSLRSLDVMVRQEAASSSRLHGQEDTALHRLTLDSAGLSAGEQLGAALSVEEISRFFERDARRYG